MIIIIITMIIIWKPTELGSGELRRLDDNIYVNNSYDAYINNAQY